MLLSVVLLLVVSGTQATHYQGTVMTYYPKETYTNGSVSVILRFKLNFKSCGDGTFTCTSVCGIETVILSNTQIDKVSGSWCQTEKITSRLLPSNSALQLVLYGGNWVNNQNGIASWRAVTDVELRCRSDTNKPNSSPQTTIFPVLSVPSNCQRNINLLAFDPDGDEVKCRYANISLSECHSPCTPPSVLNLSSTCNLSFSGISNSSVGSYAVQMVMEDFPRQTITLNHTGSHVVKTISNAISSIPIQFTFQVDSAAPSCTDGHYLPRFLFPTPEHGAQFYSLVSQTLEINIRAEATQSTITELLYSGPYNVAKNSSGSGNFILKWTPSASEDGQSHPICFIVQAIGSGSVFQSELRCVIVTVGNKPTVTSTTAVATTIPLTSSSPPPKTSYLTVLKLKISTKLSLKDNHDAIVKAIRDELIRQGLPPDTRIRLQRFSGS